MDDFRPCVVIPTYDNPCTVGATVKQIRRHVPDIIVVDDGSDEPGRVAVERLGASGQAVVVRRNQNGGKGAAVKCGFDLASRLAYSHVLQVDADGQHELADVPRLLAVALGNPHALVLGTPVFDATQPRGRAWARKISQFWVNLETGGRLVGDPQCGFRVYPLESALAAHASGDRMEFDQEIVVRMVWLGVPVVNVPTRVRYVSPDEGGVSHFRLIEDNVRISLLHTRLALQAPWRLARRALRRSRARRHPVSTPPA